MFAPTFAWRYLSVFVFPLGEKSVVVGPGITGVYVMDDGMMIYAM